jgi:hypothetical protein
MKLQRLIFFPILILFAIPVAPPKAQAQGDNPLDPTPQRRQILVGPTFAVNRNYHTGGFRTIEDPLCPLFEDGSGWGFAVGLSAEFLPAIDGKWGIIPRITFEQRPGNFRQELPDAKVLLPAESDTADPMVVNQTVSMSSDITYTLLNAEVMYKQELMTLGDLRVGVLAGPSVQYVLGGTNRQVQNLDEPDNARFRNQENLPEENNGRTLVFQDGDITQRASIRFSVKGGIQGEIGLFGNQWILTPGVYYDYGITDVTTTENWGLSSIIFQTDLRRAF